MRLCFPRHILHLFLPEQKVISCRIFSTKQTAVVLYAARQSAAATVCGAMGRGQQPLPAQSTMWSDGDHSVHTTAGTTLALRLEGQDMSIISIWKKPDSRQTQPKLLWLRQPRLCRLTTTKGTVWAFRANHYHPYPAEIEVFLFPYHHSRRKSAPAKGRASNL